MSRSVLLGLLMTALAVGCGKHGPAPAADANASNLAASADKAPESPRGPIPMSNAPTTTVVPDSGDIDATLHKLSLELRKYVMRTRSVPKNFEEFAGKSQIQAPPAPAGKKYAIQGQLVVLVRR